MLQIKSALISVFDKNRLEPIAKKLNSLEIKIYSTGGTEHFLNKLKIPKGNKGKAFGSSH